MHDSSRFFLFLMSSITAIAVAAESTTAITVTRPEELVEIYGKLSTYCDKILNLQKPSSSTERCVSKNGRLKEFSRQLDNADYWQVRWSDGKSVFHVIGRGEGTEKKIGSLSEIPIDSFFSPPTTGDDLLTRYALGRLIERSDSVKGLREYLKLFSSNSAFSNEEFIVFERERFQNSEAQRQVTERLTVLRRDGLIRKFETFNQGVLFSSMQVTEVHPNPGLSPTDFEHEIPFFTKYSLTNRPGVFLSIVAVLTAIVSLLFWKTIARLKGIEAAHALQRILWRAYWYGAGICGTGLGALAALSLLGPGGGHPPPIVYVGLAAMACVVFFVGLAIFLLLSRCVATDK